MSQEKYIGMDVHQATVSAAVMDVHGKLLMECLLETKASTIVEFIEGLQGLQPHVSRLVVCDPRKAALLKEGNKSDRIDARKLAELLRTNQLKPVYHGEHGMRRLKELGRSHLTITKDVTRVMNRIKALYRSWAIPCSGTTVYAPRHREEWLAKIARSSRAFVPATRQPATHPPPSTTRTPAGESQACCREVASSDSVDWSDSGSFAGGTAADASPFPHEAPTLGLQRFRGGDSR